MRPLVDIARWQAAIAAPHRMITRATLLTQTDSFELGTVTEGSVTLDATAATRGRCDLRIVDDGSLGLIPADPEDLFAPYGNEIQVERGVIYADGTEELVSLGIFRLDEVEVQDTGESLTIAVVGLDRSAVIIDARFEDPYEVAAGTAYTDAIAALLEAADPDIVLNFAESELVTPKLAAEEGSDRWEFAQSMATSMGMELFFDGDGECVLRPVPGGGLPVATIAEGEDGVLVDVSRRWTRAGAFNRVKATGENTGEAAPARGVATDDNPLSPTYYFGRFGRVPRFYSSPFIVTNAQAESAAEAILAKELGTARTVSFGTVVNPALEPGDVVRITRERIAIDEDHVLDQLTIPLAADGGQMSGATRAMAVTS